MDILLSINKKYILVAAVLINSIIVNNDSKINIHIMHDDLEDDEKKFLSSFFCENDKCELFFYKMNEFMFKRVEKIGSNRWPITVYYRLLAPFILDTDIERVLYLDADIVVNGSLTELYEMDLSQEMVAMCEDTFVNDKVEFRKRLNIPMPYIYYNSGVVLMNLKRIRDEYSSTDIYEIAEHYYDKLLFPDQDILNILFCSKCATVDYRKYNFICSYQRESKKNLLQKGKGAIVFHFAGGDYHKPWELNYLGMYHDVYWKYAIDIMGKTRERKCFWSNKLLKPLFVVKKRIELFAEFHCK